MKETPRRTLFEVEREKRWRIWLLFGMLLVLAFVSAWVGCLIVTVVLYIAVPEPALVVWLFTPLGVAIVLGAALAGSLVYWGARADRRPRPAAQGHALPAAGPR